MEYIELSNSIENMGGRNVPGEKSLRKDGVSRVILFLFGTTENSGPYLCENPDREVLDSLKELDGREWCESIELSVEEKELCEEVLYETLYRYFMGDKCVSIMESILRNRGFKKGSLSGIKKLDPLEDRQLLKGVDAYTFYI